MTPPEATTVSSSEFRCPHCAGLIAVAAADHRASVREALLRECRTEIARIGDLYRVSLTHLPSGHTAVSDLEHHTRSEAITEALDKLLTRLTDI